MKIVIAPDKFKGVLTAAEAARAMAEGAANAQPDAKIVILPMADGGEGTLDVLVDAASGIRRRQSVEGPLGSPVEATIGLIDQASTAILESAQAIGFSLIESAHRDPLKASSFGVGQMIRAAFDSQVDRIILALGGTATVDGGIGMMQALGLCMLDANHRELRGRLAGKDLERVHGFALSDSFVPLEQLDIAIACDVLNPLCGPHGAAAVFGPQKGADVAGVAQLERGLSNWADVLERMCGKALRNEPGSGAAGGIAMPLLALSGASIVPGVDLAAEANRLAEHIGGADLVLTGEGCLDAQSMMGKVVGAVGRMCRAADVSCVALVGAVGPGAEISLDVLDRYELIGRPITETAAGLAESAERVVRACL